MAESINTIEGREALAKIVRRARGDKRLREFAREVGVSHGVISALELGLTQDPRDATLLAIARVTEHSFEELKAILASRSVGEMRQYRTAREAWVIVKHLPREEKALLCQMIVAELGGLPSPDQ